MLRKKYLYSSALGGAFFTVPYLALGISALPCAAIGIAAYTAGIFLFDDKQKIDISSISLGDKEALNDAKEQVKKMNEVIYKLENPTLIDNAKKISHTSSQIIETVEKKPNKLKGIRNFLNYYLPVTLKILERYDEIENQKLNTDSAKKFMASVEEMVEKIKDAFEKQLSNIYQEEIVDTDAELKVFETMLKTDGFVDEIELEKKKGGENE